ncbi:MAG: hypothetical protein RIR11_2296 [Bacteroidota bacterium]|jgi:hypothetical protein
MGNDVACKKGVFILSKYQKNSQYTGSYWGKILVEYLFLGWFCACG